MHKTHMPVEFLKVLGGCSNWRLENNKESAENISCSYFLTIRTSPYVLLLLGSLHWSVNSLCELTSKFGWIPWWSFCWVDPTILSHTGHTPRICHTKTARIPALTCELEVMIPVPRKGLELSTYTHPGSVLWSWRNHVYSKPVYM